VRQANQARKHWRYRAIIADMFNEPSGGRSVSVSRRKVLELGLCTLGGARAFLGSSVFAQTASTAHAFKVGNADVTVLLATDRIPLLGYHFPWPGTGRVERRAGAYRLAAY